MKALSPYELDLNVFDTIHKKWLVLAAVDEDGRTNAMTASWGAMGIMWNKPMSWIFVRPQRFTKTLLDKTTKYSLSVLSEDYRKDYQYLGNASGFNEDKLSKVSMTVDLMEGVPVFKEADLTLVCEIKLQQALEADSFRDQGLLDLHYPGKDLHHMYMGEIIKAYVKE